MPRENSFTDSEGRSLTPDLEDEGHFEVQPRPSISSPPAFAPTYSTSPTAAFAANMTSPTSPISPELRAQGVTSPAARSAKTHASHISQWTKPSAKDKFRIAVRKVISMHRGASFMAGGVPERVGAEPGVDPRRASADMQYGHIAKECAIEITDYSSVRTSSRKMNNAEFIDLMCNDEKGQRPAWVRVRWINIGGVSWDVIKALSLRYSRFRYLKSSVPSSSLFPDRPSSPRA